MNLKALKEIPSWNWPKDAEVMFREVLLDDNADPKERCLAAELAGDYTVINDHLAEVLLSILKDSRQPDDLRSIAAVALGPALEDADIEGFTETDDPVISEGVFNRIQTTFQTLFENPDTPKLTRRRILEAAVRAKGPWHREAVASAFSDTDPEWRLTAVFCMQYLEGFENEILEALSSSEADIHYHAVQAAGSTSLGGAWPHLIDIINRPGDTGKRLLLAAIEAVVNIRPQEASEVLDELANSPDEEISEAVLDALSLAGAMEGDPYLDYEDDEYY